MADSGIDAPAALREKRARPKALGCLIEVAETLVLTIVIFWLIQTFAAQPFQVKQQSMETTLLPDQYVLVDKLTPHWSTYTRGDIVVFQPVIRDPTCDAPAQQRAEYEGTPYIKRVIGEPGDLVDLRGGNVLVNGVVLGEPYVHGATTLPLSGDTNWTVPPGRLFVMGDNREDSIDSRSDMIGPVCIGDVVGRALVRYWPLNTLTLLSRPSYLPDPEVSSRAAPIHEPTRKGVRVASSIPFPSIGNVRKSHIS